MAEKPAPTTPDWERIEAEFRSGIMSLREIAQAHPGTNHVAIARRAKKQGWTRDLSKKVQARAEALVTEKAVTPAETERRAVTERETVEANAQAIANVRLAHRGDISKGRGIVVKLMAELEGVTDRPDLIEDLQQALYQAELGDDPDEITKQAARGRAQRMRDALERVAGLQGRVGSIKGLSEALKNLVALERQAWGISDVAPNQTPLESLSDDELSAELVRLRGNA